MVCSFSIHLCVTDLSEIDSIPNVRKEFGFYCVFYKERECGTVHEIVPEQPYTVADSDWRDSTSRSSVEMHDGFSCPAIDGTVAGMADYDVVFIGYPNWWNTAPTIINTFIENHDLAGKTIIPFMTSGGGGIENSEDELYAAYLALK